MVLHCRNAIKKVGMEQQTVYTLIRLLKEQSDLGLHCLLTPICPNTYNFYGMSDFSKSMKVQNDKNRQVSFFIFLLKIYSLVGNIKMIR